MESHNILCGNSENNLGYHCKYVYIKYRLTAFIDTDLLSHFPTLPADLLSEAEKPSLKLWFARQLLCQISRNCIINCIHASNMNSRGV